MHAIQSPGILFACGKGTSSVSSRVMRDACCRGHKSCEDESKNATDPCRLRPVERLDPAPLLSRASPAAASSWKTLDHSAEQSHASRLYSSGVRARHGEVCIQSVHNARVSIESNQRRTFANGFRLGDCELESKALRRCFEADTQLAALDGAIEHVSQVKPAYVAEFVFEHGDGDLLLSMVWETRLDMNDGPRLQKTAQHWLRHEVGHTGPRKLVDVSLTDLTTGSAWAIELVATRSVDISRLPKDLVTFAAAVTVDKAKAWDTEHTESFLKFTPRTSLRSVRQMTRYSFNVTDTDLILEVMESKSILNASIGAVQEHSDRSAWSVSMYRQAWDDSFTENNTLEVGKSTTWKDSLEDWFPAEDLYEVQEQSKGVQDGKEEISFMQLIARLDSVEKIFTAPEARREVSKDTRSEANHCRGKRAKRGRR